MSEPLLNSDAKEVLRRARLLAVEQGFDRADAPQLLNAFASSGGARELLIGFGDVEDKLNRGLEFLGKSVDWPHDRDVEELTVEMGRAEAARLGHAKCGSEHLVLGLLRQPPSIGAGMLEAIGVTLDAGREAVRFMHGEVASWEPPPNSAGRSFGAPMHFAGAVAPDELARLQDEAELLRDSPGSLQRVVAIGQGVTDSGMLLELIALEIREHASVLSWRTFSTEPRLVGPPDIEASDDVGTPYRAMLSNSGGGEHEVRGQGFLVPSPPAGATLLTIVVRAFGKERNFLRVQREPICDPVDGLWRFEVPLSASET